MTASPASSVRGGFPLGLTGATAATRYVGATASGAPASGTFAVGDFCIDQSGSVFVCTVAGSPGTWTQVGGAGGGGEVASTYTAFTADVSITATTEATANTVVTAGAFTADGSSAYVVEFFAPGVGTGTNVTKLWLYQDGASIGQLGVSLILSGSATPVMVGRRLVPASGSRTYSIRASVDAGTGTVYAGAGGNGNVCPGYIRVLNV